MKKVFIFSLFICFICFNTNSQTYLNPHIVLCPENYYRLKNLSLDKIELTSNETILYFTYIATSEWVNINNDIYLQGIKDDKKYNLIKADGIPISPNKYYFEKSNPYLKFKLFFENIPSHIQEFDMIECSNNSCFNLYDISLKLDFNQGNKIDNYIENNLPFILWKYFYTPSKNTVQNQSFDDIFYNELLDMENIFNINESYQEASESINFKTRIISFLYNGNSITTIFNANKSPYNLKFIRIDFKTENEASLFLKNYSAYFHMQKISGTHYIHSRFPGRYITQKNNTIFINTLI